MTKTQCPQCKQWFEDGELDEHLLKDHMPEIPLVKNQELLPSEFSEAQEARIRTIAREENGGLKTLLIVTDLVILFIFYILWKFGLL